MIYPQSAFKNSAFGPIFNIYSKDKLKHINQRNTENKGHSFVLRLFQPIHEAHFHN